MGEVIGRINTFQGTIAGKVRTQADTSSQVADAAGEASRSVDEIASTLATVGEMAQRSAQAVEQVGSATRQVDDSAHNLQSLCSKFRV
ncbi:MAG: hypothetical protein NTV94_02095 [Planctomycetota bacterium]|nr:hypothetical protein [Planctomycetota bacterium]